MRGQLETAKALFRQFHGREYTVLGEVIVSIGTPQTPSKNALLIKCSAIKQGFHIQIPRNVLENENELLTTCIVRELVGVLARMESAYHLSQLNEQVLLGLITGREIILDFALTEADARMVRKKVHRILLETDCTTVNVGLEFCLRTYEELGKTYFDYILRNPPRSMGELRKPADYLAERSGVSP